jgi:hypothetical protein
MEFATFVEAGKVKQLPDGRYLTVEPVEGNPRRFFVRVSESPRPRPAVRHRKKPRHPPCA